MAEDRATEAIKIVKATAPLVGENIDAIVNIFYPALFRMFPSVQKHFNMANQDATSSNTLAPQRKALAEAVVAYALNIDNLGVLTSTVERIAQRHCSLGILPYQYLFVGSALIHAIKEVLGDLASPAVIDAWGQAYWRLTSILTEREAQIYKSVESKEGGWPGFKTFVVYKKVIEVEGITSLYLAPKDKKPLPDFLPGQFISIDVRLPDGTEHFRNYSLSGPPGRDYFRISVKALSGKQNQKDGFVSNYFSKTTKEGDTIDVAGPFGHIHLTSEDILSSHPLLFIAAGIGCTPIISMLHVLSERNPTRSVQYLYITQNEAAHPFRKEVEELAEKMPNLKLVTFYSRVSEKGDKFFPGKITKQVIGEYIKPQADMKVYFLGPVLWMNDIYGSLISAGFNRQQIFYELFGPYKNLG